MVDARADKYLAAATKVGATLMSPVAAFFTVHQRTDNNYILASNDFLLPTHYVRRCKLTHVILSA